MFGGIPPSALCTALWRLATLGMKKEVHLTRYQMYRRLARYRSPRREDERVLSISHSGALAHVIGYTRAQTVDTSYPNVSMNHLPYSDAVFDAVVSDQVIEHIETSVDQAIVECLRVLRPGGLMVHTTCLLNPIHCAPNDFWRFTRDGLKRLIPSGAEVLEVGSWGNRTALALIMLGLRFELVPENRWHPFRYIATRSNPLWPIVIWVVAQRKGCSE